MHSKKVSSLAWPLLTFFGAAPGRYAVVFIAGSATLGILLLRRRIGWACAWLHGLAKGRRIATGALLLLAACDAALAVAYFLPILRPWSEDPEALAMQCLCMALCAAGAIVLASLGVLALCHSSILPDLGRWLDAQPRWRQVAIGLTCLLLAAGVLYLAGEALWWLNVWQPKKPAQ